MRPNKEILTKIINKEIKANLLLGDGNVVNGEKLNHYFSDEKRPFLLNIDEKRVIVLRENGCVFNNEDVAHPWDIIDIIIDDESDIFNKKYVKLRIKDIIDNFNFKRVQMVMEALDWHYFDDNDNIPSLNRLKETAKYTLNEAINKLKNDIINNDYSYCETGGFRAIAFIDKENFEKELCLELAFIVEKYTNYFE